MFLNNRFRLRPRVLWSKENINIATKLQGQEVSFPLGISPTGLQLAAHSEGERATARGNENGIRLIHRQNVEKVEVLQMIVLRG